MLKLHSLKGGGIMNNTFLKVEEVAELLGVSKSYAYKVVRQLNNELKEKGFLTISGRINKAYFMERVYSTPAERKD